MWLSLSIVGLLAAILILGSVFLGAPIELSMFFALIVLIPVVMSRGFSYGQVQGFAFDAIRKVLELIFILLAVGVLISTWAQAGTIPTIIRFGLNTISPEWFYVSAILLCAATSLVTGTSWGTMGSVGIALMVVGNSLGLPAPLTAGAIISGAYFGDKLSPLSDSTNLSAAITNTPLMTHVRYLLYTTLPAFVLTLVIYGVIGVFLPYGGGDNETIPQIVSQLEATFDLGLVTLIPAAITIGLLVLRWPPFVSIMGGAIAAVVVAMTVQGATVSEVVTSIYSGYVSETGVANIDDLVSGGGLLSMAGLAFLFMFAVGVSGLLSGAGFVQSLLRYLMRWANSRRKLMTLTSPVTLIALALGASFSFAAVIVGTLFSPAYARLDLKSQNLSRTIEDSGTVYDAFFPWSGGAVFASAVLGVATVQYMPFMFFAFLSTAFSILFSLTQFRVAVEEKTTGELAEGPQQQKEAYP